MSTIVNLRQRISDVVKDEEEKLFSRESIVGAVIAFTEGQQYGVGAVVGLANVGTITPAIRAGSAGNGALGTWTAGAGCFPGVWTALCVEPTTNLGKFELRNPDGKPVGIITVGSAYSGGGLAGTLADGATDWAAGDVIDFTVAAAAAPNIAFYDPAATNGAGVPYGVLLIPADANQPIPTHVVLRRHATIAAVNLVWGTGVTTQAQKDAALAFLLDKQTIVSNRAVV